MYNIQLHVSALYVGHHQVVAHIYIDAHFIMWATFTNPTIYYDVRRGLVPLRKLPHILCSHIISSLDNLMMVYIQGRNM